MRKRSEVREQGAVDTLPAANHRRKSSIGGADPSMIPVTDEIFPGNRSKFVRGEGVNGEVLPPPKFFLKLTQKT